MRIAEPLTIALLVICTTLAGPPAANAATPDAKTTPSPPWSGLRAEGRIVRGDFTQKKYLAELDHPLISTGHFVAAQGRGLIWQVEHPVSARLLITPDQLVQRSNGHETLHIDADQQPGLRMVAAVLLAVFQANTQRLRQFFTVRKSHTPNGDWQLILEPKSRAVKSLIKQVTLTGAKRLERVEIAEPNGDRDRIDLQIDDHGPAKLTADEQAAFSR